MELDEAESPPVAGSSTSQPPDATQNEACVACRSVKRKCMHDDKGSRCIRCTRLELECVYHQQKRGRKPGVGAAGKRKSVAGSPGGSPLIGGTKASPPWLAHPAAAAAPHILGPPLLPHSPFSSSNPTPLSATTLNHPASSSFASDASPSSQPGPAHLPAAPAPTLKGGFTLKRLLENREEEPPSHSLADAFSAPGEKGDSARVFEDIVASGVVPLEDVEFLFEFYFEHLNPATSLLDPVLHTPAFVRSSSAFLFSALITVTLRIARPSLYPPALKFAKRLFGKSMEHSECSLEFVQATALLIESGLGFVSFLSALSHVADHRCADQRSLPRLIPPEKIYDPVAWIFDHMHSHPCPSEVGLAPLVGIGRLLGLYEALVSTRQGELPSEHLLACLEAELETWRGNWGRAQTMLPLNPASHSIVRFVDQVFRFQMDELRLLLAVSDRFDALAHPTKSPVVAFSRCVVSARAIIDLFRSESFSYLYQDSTWIGIVSAAIWLVQNFVGMNHAEQVATTECITLGQAKCEEASTGNQSMAAYTGRLFRHLLSKTTTEEPAADQVKEGPHHLAPLGRASGSFVMASPASHFDNQWACSAGTTSSADTNGSFFNLMLRPQESWGEGGLIYPTDDDQLWQSLFPLFGDNGLP
ncbi:hypothetical protein RQP46_001459 [Phenoliferia psychrophenolica]